MGHTRPRALAVIESVLARFSVLVECVHLAEGQDAFWVALQPDGLPCGFCWEAARVCWLATRLEALASAKASWAVRLVWATVN